MNLDLLFYPESVAVIGASDNLGGGKLPYFQILQANGFAGALYPVNPRRAEVCGVKAYASIDDLPGPVDFALVAAPVEQSINIVKAAVRKGIKFIHFFTSGFGETGNLKLEKDLVREARKGHLRIVGPNCIGVQCFESKLSFRLTQGARAAGHDRLPGTIRGNYIQFCGHGDNKRNMAEQSRLLWKPD